MLRHGPEESQQSLSEEEGIAVIRGTWDTGQVWIDDRELSPERSQALMNHSPTGFAWGVRRDN
jgi:hypothetical protein